MGAFESLQTLARRVELTRALFMDPHNWREANHGLSIDFTVRGESRRVNVARWQPDRYTFSIVDFTDEMSLERALALGLPKLECLAHPTLAQLLEAAWTALELRGLV